MRKGLPPSRAELGESRGDGAKALPGQGKQPTVARPHPNHSRFNLFSRGNPRILDPHILGCLCLDLREDPSPLEKASSPTAVTRLC